MDDISINMNEVSSPCGYLRNSMSCCHICTSLADWLRSVMWTRLSVMHLDACCILTGGVYFPDEKGLPPRQNQQEKLGSESDRFLTVTDGFIPPITFCT